jgi:hypothetical protein
MARARPKKARFFFFYNPAGTMATLRRPPLNRPAAKKTAPRRRLPARSENLSLAPIGQGVDLDQRYQIEYVRWEDVIPYEYNPRDNEKAIPAVASSIRSVGFIVPCVVDANNVLIAGHTRHAAARLIGMTHIPVLRATHLSQDQINAFRLIDNKVSELADWNHDMLAGEIGKLAASGINFTQFGWSQEEIDCLSEIAADECLSAPVVVSAEDQARVSERRAPITTRIVIGEFVFFIPSAMYRNWAEGIRQLCEFSDENITRELKTRLGLPLV